MSNHAWTNGPPGSTPLDADEAEGLLPAHINTQSELNAWEQLNIANADMWAISRRRRKATTVLTPHFAEELHRRMFNRTWRWAGKYRLTGKNIGAPVDQIRVAVRERLADAQWWLDGQVYGIDEIATRLHYQLVGVHPWPNGNGRWARLMADVLLHAEGQPRFSWGGTDLGSVTRARADYIDSLQAADRGEFGPLLAFARR